MLNILAIAITSPKPNPLELRIFARITYHDHIPYNHIIVGYHQGTAEEALASTAASM